MLFTDNYLAPTKPDKIRSTQINNGVPEQKHLLFSKKTQGIVSEA